MANNQIAANTKALPAFVRGTGNGIGEPESFGAFKIKEPAYGSGIRGSLPPARLLKGSERVQKALAELERASAGVRESSVAVSPDSLRQRRAEADRADTAAQADAFAAGKTGDVGRKHREKLDRDIDAEIHRHAGWREFRNRAIDDLQAAFDEERATLLANAEEAHVPLQADWDGPIEALRQIGPQMAEWRALQRWLVAGGGQFVATAPEVQLRGTAFPIAEVLEALQMVGLTDKERQTHAQRVAVMPSPRDVDDDTGPASMHDGGDPLIIVDGGLATE